jgi:hypothetical protein
MHQSDYCNEIIFKYNVTRPEEGKPKIKIINKFIKTVRTTIKTSYMQGYPKLQSVYRGQEVHQQPVHHGQVAHQQPVQDG